MSLSSGYKDYIFYADGAALPGLRFDFTSTTPGNSYVKIYYQVNDESFIEAEDATWYDITNTTGWVKIRVKIEMYTDGSGNEPTLETFQIQSRNFGGFLGDAIKFTDDAGGDETFLKYDFDYTESWTLQVGVKSSDVTSEKILFALHDTSGNDTIKISTVSGSSTTLKITEVKDGSVNTSNTCTAGDSFTSDFVYITVSYDHVLNILQVYQNDVEVLDIFATSYDTFGNHDQLWVGKDLSTAGSTLDPFIGYMTDHRKSPNKAIEDEVVRHYQENMPWKDPTSARNANGSVVIDAGGIRLRKAEFSQVDRYGRSLDIGSYGILARDASGNILHDIAQSSDISPYKFFGHYYYKGTANILQGYTSLISATNTATMEDDVDTVYFTPAQIFAVDGIDPPANIKGFRVMSYIYSAMLDAKSGPGTRIYYEVRTPTTIFDEDIKGLSQDGNIIFSRVHTYDTGLNADGNLQITFSGLFSNMLPNNGFYNMQYNVYILGYYA